MGSCCCQRDGMNFQKTKTSTVEEIAPSISNNDTTDVNVYYIGFAINE